MEMFMTIARELLAAGVELPESLRVLIDQYINLIWA